jgi:F-type H+-transporting ATPase subunit a
MHLSPDEVVFWQYGFAKLNLTILTTWVLMGVLVIGAKLVTRNIGQIDKRSG